MVCCKVMADYRKLCEHFQQLFDEFGKRGDSLWHNRCFYFANVDDENVTEQTVRKIVKKYCGSDVFIECYNATHMPSEDEQVNWWIEDKLIKIGYIEIEIKYQEQFKTISQKLTDIENTLKQLDEVSRKNKQNKITNREETAYDTRRKKYRGKKARSSKEKSRN